MNKAEKCPKCSGGMMSGEVTRDVRIRKQGDLVGDNMYAFFCRRCGFIELYKEPSTKEPWRWPEQQEAILEETRQPKEERSSAETWRKKLVR
jgi:YgiT-type zinc finger domain-containing protein